MLNGQFNTDYQAHKNDKSWEFAPQEVEQQMSDERTALKRTQEAARLAALAHAQKLARHRGSMLHTDPCNTVPYKVARMCVDREVH